MDLMRFTTGVLFGAFVVRPVLTKMYAPFKPMVDDHIEPLAMDFAQSMVLGVRDKMYDVIASKRRKNEN